MDSTIDLADSRKRPLDSDSEHSMIKRSNCGQGNDVLLKQLIPSHLAGVILGKGGETIVSLQTSTGAVIKMSKGGDFYPGTSDRICLVTGPVDSVRNAHNMIWEKIRNRVDSSTQPGVEELKVKIVVPNATVGMIIGKGGCYVKQIKDDTGAYVQISQKAPDTLLVERVVTIAGTVDQMSQAFEMVYQMIINDPQSSSCPYISYAEFKGPVANANPTGSPFASNAIAQPMDIGCASFTGPPQIHMGAGCMTANGPAVETMKSTLRNSGFSVQASDEITSAMCTLANYGLIGPGVGFPGFGFGSGPGQCGLTLEYLSSIFGGRGNVPVAQKVDKFPGGGQFAGLGNGPDMSGGFGSFGNGVNQNSFGMGPQSVPPDGTQAGSISKELQIPESIVGAVLGHGGRAIVEIQRMTSATIQISKKGVFAPGTRNRIATISGGPAAVERAMYLVQQCIQQEETKRTRQEQMLK